MIAVTANPAVWDLIAKDFEISPCFFDERSHDISLLLLQKARSSRKRATAR
jgi:hypothetical protein